MARSASGPRGGAAVAGANLVLRFLLEIAMLVALGYWGFATGDAAWQRVALGLGAPLLALVAWGALVAPRAKWRLADPWRLGVETVLFGLAGWALWAAGAGGWAIALIVVAAINVALLTALRQR